MSLWSRLANVFGSGRVERDLDDELRFHIEERTRALVGEGMPPDAAAREATRRVGNRLHLREQSRDVKLMPWLDSLVRDLRLGLRRLRRDVVVNGAAIVSLGLALGACLAAFSLVDALMLRPLPIHQPEQLVYLAHTRPDGSVSDRFNYPLFERLRDGSRDQVDLFAMSTQVIRPAVFDGADGRKEQVRTQYVSGSAFGVLGIAAAAGRVVGPDDDTQPGASPVAVLSHAYWMRRFGGNPSVIGRRFVLEDTPIQIVGVAEARFTGVEPGRPTDVWLPAMMYTARAFGDPNFNWFRTFGRLKSATEREQTASVLQAEATGFRREYAERFGARQSPDAVARFINAPVEVRSATNGPSPLRDEFGRSLWMLTATAALILFIAGSNVANLFLARTASREREMSLRLSIGAGRGRLIQQALIESTLVAGLAAAVGSIVSRTTAAAVVQMLANGGDPVSLDLVIDARFVATAAALVLFTTLLFGLAPALRASSASPMTVLRAGDRRSGTRATAMRPFVGLQVAFCLIVLFVGGLLVTSAARLSGANPGFDASNVLLLALDPAAGADAEAQRAAMFQVLDRIGNTPGVEAASLAENSLLGRTWTMEARVPETAHDTLEVTLAPVSDRFFETMRIPLRAGRTFAAADMALGQSTAIIVNETFARQYVRGGDVLGQGIDGPFGGQFGASRARRGEIVGVVGDTKYDLREAAAPTIYLPLRGRATIYARVATGTGGMDVRLRDVIHAASPLLRVTAITPLTSVVEETLLRERLLALLSGFFAGVGLLLAGVGLYGVFSYAVAERTREIGIRMALGARPLGVVRTVLAGTVPVAIAGAAGGVATGMYLSRFIESLLFEVTALDAWSVALPLGALAATAGLAVALPAWRAARVDPVIALRHE